jgi:cell division protein FtsZ
VTLPTYAEPEPVPTLEFEPQYAVVLEPVIAAREILPEPEVEPLYEAPRIETPRVDATRPVAQPAPQQRAYQPAPEPYVEPEMAFEPAPAPTPAPEPRITQPQVRPVARIVDPSVADDEDMAPLFPEASHYADDRRQKGGWLSIFGRPRQEAPQQHHQQPTRASSPQLMAEAPPEETDDLEIPSFLRRLAN